MLSKTTSTVSWRDVSVVDIQSPWAFRCFGLGVVSLRCGGHDDSKIDVPGVDRRVMDTIVQLASAKEAPREQIAVSESVTNGQPGSAPRPPWSGRRVLYKSSQRDLVTANLIYGHVVVFGTGAVMTFIDLADQLAIFDDALNVFRAHFWEGSLFLCGAILCGGSVVALIRYRGFTVSADLTALSITYGWLSTQQREVKSSAVSGITARRNLIEMVLDRVRVALLTTDSDAQMGTNMVLPSLPRLQVGQILDYSLPELPRPALLESAGNKSITRSLSIFTAVGALSLGLGWTLHQVLGATLTLAAVGSAAACYLLATAVRLANAEFAVFGTTVGWGSKSIADHEIVLSATGLHSFSLTRARSARLSLVRVHYFAGRPRSLASLSLSQAISEQMARIVEVTSPGIAARRLHLTDRQPTARSPFVHDPRQ
ncbi:hypothetical protein ACIPWF_20240 [Paenarthrobacter sp. NPDC089989]|uniref:hypothetical protein n=1 Tax=unclassified Paenarthrobacter TaxID=2634190 RepID=UPI00380A1492